jgi:ATP-binding cassette subfamily F protein 3
MLIGVDRISVVHGGRTLFQDVSFQISPGDKVGLIGKNGAGKSTMLKLILGINQPDEGSVSRNKEISIGYLPQEMPLPEGKSVYEETSQAFADLLAMDSDLEKINAELTNREDYESEEYSDLIHRQSEITEALNSGGWYEISMKVEKVLHGLGFETEDFKRPTSEFSGGWRMRIELAKILLQSPEVLLLDEPTNHLDIESIQWLESFLKEMNVAIVLISHDIAFLNSICNRTIDITHGRIYDFPLPYSKYLERRQELRETLEASYKNQQKKIKDTEAFINRFRAKNTKASQVQSRIKMLDRMDKIELEQEEISSLNIRFPEAPRSGKVILEAKDLSKSYGDKSILHDINFLISRGEKVAFVGKNGAGKTTLSKVIVGETDHSGKLKSGHQVELGYYAQDQSDTMNPELNVMQVVENENTQLNQVELRSLLGAFLFSGDDQYKKVKVLSGGEKARLALCKLLLTPVNFLVLDEPTNHLDIQSKSILKEALKSFKGTLIVVSHDRDFLSGLTDKVFEFTGGIVREHLGDIKEYLQYRKSNEIDQVFAEKVVKTKEKVLVESENKKDYEERKQRQKEERKLKSDISKAEKAISEMEEEMEVLNEKLAANKEFDPELLNRYQTLNKELENSMNHWEKLSRKLEAFSNED